MAENASAPQGPAAEQNCLSAAISYLKNHWSPIPIPPGQKAPSLRDWQNLRLGPEDAPHYFVPGMNIGVLLGEPSQGLVDIDLDRADALFLASEFLPKTGAIFGRRSKPASHWLFVVRDPVDTLRLKDLDGSVLLELRSAGCQTVFPPSIHSGERIEWARNEMPSTVDGTELRKCVVLLAITCLVVPDWPLKGSRHERVDVEFDRESHTRRRLVILLNRPQTSVPGDPSGPNASTRFSEPPINDPTQPNGVGGDTGDGEDA